MKQLCVVRPLQARFSFINFHGRLSRKKVYNMCVFFDIILWLKCQGLRESTKPLINGVSVWFVFVFVLHFIRFHRNSQSTLKHFIYMKKKTQLANMGNAILCQFHHHFDFCVSVSSRCTLPCSHARAATRNRLFWLRSPSSHRRQSPIRLRDQHKKKRRRRCRNRVDFLQGNKRNDMRWLAFDESKTIWNWACKRFSTVAASIKKTGVWVWNGYMQKVMASR